MEKIKLLTLTMLAMLMLCALSFSPAFAIDTTRFSLALASNQIQYSIPAGTTFNGSVATTGMVRVWVTAPNSEQIVNLGIIDKITSFSFIAQQNGTYTFNFENDQPNTITVTFSYTANPQLPNSSTGIPITNILVIVGVAVVGSLVIFFGIRRKTRKAMAAYQKAELQSQNSGK
jgi:hypothetical protein